MEKFFKFFRLSNQPNTPITPTDRITSLILNVVNFDGRMVRLKVLYNSTSAEVIANALEEFSEKSENIYSLLHVPSAKVIEHNISMESACVADNDEVCLIIQHEVVKNAAELNTPPNQAMIDEATMKQSTAQNSSEMCSNFKNFVKFAVGGQSYVRNFLIQMALESAYIISAGPYADFLIEHFKQKILNRRKFQEDAVKSLTELGFEESRCIYAMKLKKNIYSEALNWLIDHASDTNTYLTYNRSVSLIRTVAQNVQEKFERLSQIVRIYGRSGQHYCESLLNVFSEMGFDKETSLNALKSSDWNPASAVRILCGEQSSVFLCTESSITQKVLESASVQHSLGDPETFMTIIYILGSGAGSSGIEHNWESTTEKYHDVAYVLKRYNEEKHIDILTYLN